MNNNYITLLTSLNHANKSYIKDLNGKITKSPPDYASIRTAITRPIADLLELKITLEQIGNMQNAIVILGYIKGTEDGTPYRIISSSQLKELVQMDDIAGLHDISGTNYAARLKNTFTQSSFFVIDRDEVEGMPQKLKYDNHEDWWRFMQSWLPMLQGAGYLLAPSNSGRILDNGAVYAKDNHHLYLQAKNANDIERFGKAGLIHAFNHSAGFMKEIRSNGKVTGKRPWTVYDPTTFSREREVYDGMPIVQGEGLSVAKANIIHVEGGIVDTEKLADPSNGQQKESGMDLVKTSSGNYQVHDHTSLTMNTIIDFKDSGMMPLKEFEKLGIDRERCQSPFRPDSNSMAAYVNRTKNGSPFIHDVGTGTNYYLNSSIEEVFEGIKPKIDLINGFVPAGKKEETSKDITKTLQTEDKAIVQKNQSLDLSFLDDLVRDLRNEEPGTGQKRVLAEQLCRDVDGFRHDLRQHWHEIVREIMGWNKNEFVNILKDYRGSWYKSDDPDVNIKWLIDNIVVMTEGIGGFYNLFRNVYQSLQSLNNLYGHLNIGDDTPGSIMAASEKKQIADGLGWHPVDQKIFNNNGCELLNLYRAPEFNEIEGDVSEWLTLCNHIYGDHVDMVLDHMAFTLQKPDIKIRWQILTWGEARTGKTLTLEPLIKILGEAGGIVHSDDVEGGWGDIYKCKKVLVFEEVMMNDKREFNRLKTKLVNNGMEHLNIKGKGQVMQRNLYSIYMFSNYADALRFEKDQQKILVIHAPAKKLSDEFYKALGDKIEFGKDFCNAVYHFLMNRDVSRFQYSSLPVQTDAEFAMIQESKPDYEKEIKEMIEFKESVFGQEAFSYSMIQDEMRIQNIRCSGKNLKRVLNENGCFNHQRTKRVDGKLIRGRFWAVKTEASPTENHDYFESLSADVKLGLLR